MDAMLQRHCARYIYVLPDGLRELMSDISREVLRSQPYDMYTFIADYLDALMITRENARVAARLVQSLTEMATTTATFLEETGMNRDEIDDIVSAIQRTFKKSIEARDPQREKLSEEVEEANIVSNILHEIDIDQEKAELAAVIIQQAYRRFKERKEREKELLAGMVDWRVAARSAIHLYRRTGVTNEEANRAATLIKAAYKGYYTRRLMKQIAAMEKAHTYDEIAYLPSGREDGEEEEEFEDDDADERPKSVKINYDTVRPHVDFDTGIVFEQPIPAKRVSTANSIARYSMQYIFDSAIQKVQEEEHSMIAEEELESAIEESSTIIVGGLAAATMPIVSPEPSVLKQLMSEKFESGEGSVIFPRMPGVSFSRKD